MNRKQIDSLKGIGILGVVIVHVGINGTYGYLNAFVANGARGVQLMYLINGYLIFASLERVRENRINLGRWYRGKLFRLMPMYWFFTALHLLIFGTGERFYLGPLKRVSFLNILCNFLCLHGFFPYYIASINLNWFMANLVVWYIIAPFVCKILDSFERILLVFLIIVPLDYISLVLLGKLPIIENRAIWNDYVNILCFPAEFPIILLGGVIFHLMKKIQRNKNRRILPAAGTLLSFLCLGLLITGSGRFLLFTEIFSYGVAFAGLFFMQILRPWPALDNCVLAILGKYSYGIYLSHLFAIDLLHKLSVSVRLSGLGLFGDVLRLGLVLLISLGISIIWEKGSGVIMKLHKRKSFLHRKYSSIRHLEK